MSEKRIDDSSLEGISGAGGDQTPEEVTPDKPGKPPEIISGGGGGGGNTGSGDVQNPGGQGDGEVTQG